MTCEHIVREYYVGFWRCRDCGVLRWGFAKGQQVPFTEGTGWVRVEDELPRFAEQVLVYLGWGTYKTAAHFRNDWDIVDGPDITHWMAIPPLPQESVG